MGRYKRLVSLVFSGLVGGGRVDGHCAARYQDETAEPPDLKPAEEGEIPPTIEVSHFLGLGPARVTTHRSS